MNEVPLEEAEPARKAFGDLTEGEWDVPVGLFPDLALECQSGGVYVMAVLVLMCVRAPAFGT
ncbi:hypothetical protein [Streptomyces soliscabiei]|uniref:hypothetical protein n=1 Tax=Streptomyces soliscabiei TaxID=588897 RepID=UPI0029A71FC0|nr:hypothetical protein [Streptomyces sp. NY05-11A]MDX2683026.1 hypothetical protein [Streptomyces sp. NY05-11A]